MKWLATGTLAAGLASAAAQSSPIRLETRSALNSRVANVHVDYEQPVQGSVAFTYGDCDSQTPDDAHHVVARSNGGADGKSRRLVWVMPRGVSSGGCISAWSESGELLGRSATQHIDEHSMKKRDRTRRAEEAIQMNNSTGIDVWGPWFDGVSLLESNEQEDIDVEAAKAKEVAIVGAGMGGLTTYLILKQAGLTNLTILEASGRLGGRIRTEYLSGSDFDYSYQEMGPMRIPATYVAGNTTYNISDQQPFFQMVNEINRINEESGNDDLHVDLIPFIQYSNNGLNYFNGRKMENGLPPTVAEVAEDPSLGQIPPEIPESAEELAATVEAALAGEEFYLEVATNFWQAHADFLRDKGPDGLPGDQWSEFGFMVNYLKATVFDANAVSGGTDSHNYLGNFYYAVLFAPGGSMKTIDGGMNRLPKAFHPLVDDITKFDTKVERIEWDEEEERLTLKWRGNYTETEFQSQTFDYAVMAAPLPVVQRMRLPPLPFAMRNAINTMQYGTACKVALEYRSRFWEHFDNPIYGSCSTVTDIPGIGSICYPSYNINGTGPASVLASYEINRPMGVEWAGVSEEQHVQYVVDAMTEIHGDIAREEYTGNYNRKCWIQDEFASAGWADPHIGNHETYLPEFFTTHSHMIFVGEHASVTHAWIASAIESGVRGGVQLLLELGLVDEAKEVVDKWAARWISL